MARESRLAAAWLRPPRRGATLSLERLRVAVTWP